MSPIRHQNDVTSIRRGVKIKKKLSTFVKLNFRKSDKKSEQNIDLHSFYEQKNERWGTMCPLGMNRVKALKSRYSAFSIFFSKSKSQENPTWVWDQIGFRSRSQLGFGHGANSDLVSEPTRIWSRKQLGLGLGANSDLVSEPTGIWS